jgi:hypothetical protein
LKQHLKGHAKKQKKVVTIDIGTANTPKMVSSVNGTTEAKEVQIKEAEKKLDDYKKCTVKQTLYRSISNRHLLEITTVPRNNDTTTFFPSLFPKWTHPQICCILQHICAISYDTNRNMYLAC